MKRNRIWAIWLPSVGSRSYFFSVPRVLIYVLFGTLLVSWIMLGVGGYLGVRLYRDYRNTEKENTRLVKKKTELVSLRSSIDNIREYEKLIRNALDLERQPLEGVPMGLGGGPTNEPPHTMPEKSLAYTNTNPIVQAEPTPILKQAEYLQENLKELVEIMRERRQFLDHTPSILPVETKDYWISSSFGWRRSPFKGLKEFHNGVDISSHKGTPVVAPGNGRVVKKGKNRYRGKYLQISHGWGRITTYAHLLEFNVTQGQKVKRGQVIAYMGSTGRSTGSHLHYEIEINGKVVNPMRHILSSRAVESHWRPLVPVGGAQ